MPPDRPPIFGDTRDKVGLLPTQKSEVAQIIEDAGFLISEFQWSQDTSVYDKNVVVEVLTHRATEYSFRFDQDARFHQPRRSVVKPGRENETDILSADHWAQVLAHVQIWLQNVRDQVDAPDPWNEFRGFSDVWANPETPFTLGEIKAITARLATIEQYIITNTRATQQLAVDIHEKFEWLEGELKNQGRKAWLMMFVGTIFSQATSWGLNLKHIHGVIAQIGAVATKILPHPH